MRGPNGILEREVLTQFVREFLVSVAPYRQSTTAFRAIQAKRCQHYGPARFNRSAQLREIRRTVVCLGEEVKYRAVMPNVPRRDGPIASDVGLNPLHAIRDVAEPVSSARERRARQVDHREARYAAREQVIREAGIPAPHIDDSRTSRETGRFDQPQ